MAQFMIMLRSESIDFKSFSPEDYQKLVQNFETWSSALEKEGKLIGSGSLKSKLAKTIRVKKGKSVIDGPYCETKEALSGFFLTEAADEDEAIQQAQGCPFLPLGGSVEVSPTELDLVKIVRRP